MVVIWSSGIGICGIWAGGWRGQDTQQGRVCNPPLRRVGVVWACWLHGEGGAAAAGLLGVGVLEDEALAVEAVGKVELGADQVDVGLLVHHHLDAKLLDDLVRLALLVGDGQVIGEAGAAAALDGDAQAHVVLDPFFVSEILDLLGGLCRNLNAEFYAVLCDGHGVVTPWSEVGDEVIVRKMSPPRQMARVLSNSGSESHLKQVILQTFAEPPLVMHREERDQQALEQEPSGCRVIMQHTSLGYSKKTLHGTISNAVFTAFVIPLGLVRVLGVASAGGTARCKLGHHVKKEIDDGYRRLRRRLQGSQTRRVAS